MIRLVLYCCYMLLHILALEPDTLFHHMACATWLSSLAPMYTWRLVTCYYIQVFYIVRLNRMPYYMPPRSIEFRCCVLFYYLSKNRVHRRKRNVMF